MNHDQEETLSALQLNIDSVPQLLNKVSSFSKLRRITTYIHRFINGCRRQERPRRAHITVPELNDALLFWIKLIQKESYPLDLIALKKGKSCSKQLQSLDPILDSQESLRVGSRLQQSNLPYEEQHPILLPKNSLLTKRIIDHYHLIYLHVGPQALMALLYRRYWIASARQTTIRNRIQKCATCRRFRPAMLAPKMAPVPFHRVVKLKPFEATGMNFGGSFTITLNRIRGSRSLKAYLCLFICFTTKAVHLEAVTDLSTEAFLRALKRFLARRGRCNYLCSDCGTNFKGAARYLNALQQYLTTDHVRKNSLHKELPGRLTPLRPLTLTAFGRLE